MNFIVVNDLVFLSEMMGKGLVIMLIVNKVYVFVDGLLNLVVEIGYVYGI